MHQHEMFDHPAVPGHADREHVLSEDCPAAPDDSREPCVCQYKCLACHDGAHAQYEQDVTEVLDGSLVVDGAILPGGLVYAHTKDGPQTTIPIDSAHHGPTKFLMDWHEASGFCPLHAAEALA